MNLPNKLTVARFFMTGAFVIFMSFEYVWAYAVGYALFVAASITDYYDGKIARERNLITNFGKLLDPIADKLLVAAAFLMMMKIPQVWIPAWTVIVILAREFLISGMRMLAMSEGGEVIAANKYGKNKTLLQMGYVIIFLPLATIMLAVQQYQGVAEQVPREPGYYQMLLTYTSAALMIYVALYTVYSGVQYVRLNWHNLNLNDI